MDLFSESFEVLVAHIHKHLMVYAVQVTRYRYMHTQCEISYFIFERPITIWVSRFFISIFTLFADVAIFSQQYSNFVCVCTHKPHMCNVHVLKHQIDTYCILIVAHTKRWKWFVWILCLIHFSHSLPLRFFGLQPFLLGEWWFHHVPSLICIVCKSFFFMFRVQLKLATNSHRTLDVKHSRNIVCSTNMHLIVLFTQFHFHSFGQFVLCVAFLLISSFEPTLLLDE